MRIGPKDPFSGVPQEQPEEVKQKSSQAEFPTESVVTPASTTGTDSADSIKSIYTGFTDKTGLGEEFINQTLGDFKGAIADADLERIGDMLAGHVAEDPSVQGKLDRILSLAK